VAALAIKRVLMVGLIMDPRTVPFSCCTWVD
jgi:hypothetical protein